MSEFHWLRRVESSDGAGGNGDGRRECSDEDCESAVGETGEFAESAAEREEGSVEDVRESTLGGVSAGIVGAEIDAEIEGEHAGVNAAVCVCVLN